MPGTTFVSKTLPSMSGGTADRDSSFAIGRRAFFNMSHVSHTSNNVNKNIDYSSIKGKKSSIVYGKPINDKSADFRIQRLRLATIGGGSSKVKNQGDIVSFNRTTPDNNLIDNVLNRARNKGAVAPKKKPIGSGGSGCCA